EQLDVDAVVSSATAAFEEAGMEAQTVTYGSGDRAETNVIATGGPVVRGVVTVRPHRGMIEVSASPACFPGDAGELSDMIFDGLVYEDAWRRFPAFEGPDWQPRFYFPEDGSPVYWDEEGKPLEPQPTPSAFPDAPYGG